MNSIEPADEVLIPDKVEMPRPEWVEVPIMHVELEYVGRCPICNHLWAAHHYDMGHCLIDECGCPGV